MEREIIAAGGVQYVPHIATAQQIIYLDVDGASTSYNGAILTVENVEVQDVPFYYMDELQLFAMENNFKVCLDIPHLFLSVKRVGLTQRQALEYLIRDDWWKENIVELHLHDFNDKKCHLNLGEGELDFEVLKELLNYFGEECPLIVETTVQDLEIQGVSEVKKVL
jgi:endonuclease IV